MTTTFTHPTDHDFWRRGIFLPKSRKDKNYSINFFFKKQKRDMIKEKRTTDENANGSF